MTLIELVKLRTKEDNLKKQTAQWRQIIYQTCSEQARWIAQNPDQLSRQHLAEQQQFFNRKLRNHMQGLKNSQTELQLVQSKIKRHQNDPTVKILKFIDFYGVVILVSVMIAGILSITF